GKVLQTFKGPPTPDTTMVYSVAVSATGRYALSGSSDGDRVVCLWDLNNGKEHDFLRGHKDAVYAVAFSAEGRYALSGGLDRTVRHIRQRRWDHPAVGSGNRQRVTTLSRAHRQGFGCRFFA